MLSEKYSHLKLQRLENEFNYVIFENQDQFIKAITVLSARDADFFSFSFKDEKSLICPVA